MKYIIVIFSALVLFACSKPTTNPPINPPDTTGTGGNHDTTVNGGTDTTGTGDTTSIPGGDTTKPYTIKGILVSNFLINTNNGKAFAVIGSDALDSYVDFEAAPGKNLHLELVNLKDGKMTVTPDGSSDQIVSPSNIYNGDPTLAPSLSDTTTKVYVRITGFDEMTDGMSQLDIFLDDDTSQFGGTLRVRNLSESTAAAIKDATNTELPALTIKLGAADVQTIRQ